VSLDVISWKVFTVTLSLGAASDGVMHSHCFGLCDARVQSVGCGPGPSRSVYAAVRLYLVR